MATKVLVLGGGFAGISAVRELARARNSKVSVQLVNRHRWSVFWPLLPDLISGRILPSHVAYMLGPFCRRNGIEFTQAEVTAIHPGENRVETSAGELKADYLIICLGCDTNFFGNKDIQSRAPGLKSLHEGVIVRQMVKRVIEGRLSRSSDQRAHIVIVGGGYTGFEVASHVAHFLRSATRISFDRIHEIAQVLILEKAPKVLSNTSPGVQHWAKKLIGHYGVQVRTQVSVEKFEDERKVRLSDGSTLEDAMVVWTAGVIPGPACSEMDVPTVHGGRLTVDEYLRVKGLPNVFAAGDVAGPIRPGEEHPLRMSVQFSEVGGKCAAQNAMRTIESKDLKVFDPWDLGYVIPLAPGHATGVVLGREMHGKTPFFLHYAMSALRSMGWWNKMRVAKDLWMELLPEKIRTKRIFEEDMMHFEP